MASPNLLSRCDFTFLLLKFSFKINSRTCRQSRPDFRVMLMFRFSRTEFRGKFVVETTIGHRVKLAVLDRFWDMLTMSESSSRFLPLLGLGAHQCRRWPFFVQPSPDDRSVNVLLLNNLFLQRTRLRLPFDFGDVLKLVRHHRRTDTLRWSDCW